MKKLLFYSLLLGLALQGYFSISLPDVVVSSFSAAGTAKAGMHKSFYLFLTLTALVSCSLISLTVDHICRKIPVKYISFPFKDYWFAAGRKEEAFSKMAKWTDFFGILVNLFLISIFYLTYRANTDTPPSLNMTWFYLTVSLFFIITVCWLIALYIAFKPPHK